MDINDLIKNMTPLYNEYKQNSKSISGTNALLLMWDIGNVLKDYLDQNDVAPHSLYREVYGKSEGGSNISRKSWITREFQSRCYRIRNMFETKNQIYSDFPTLAGFTSFRESMPFLCNPKFNLKGSEREDLLKLLNSNKSKSYILKEVTKLKASKIGIKNSRNQRLADLENEKKIFINLYNYVYHLSKEDPTQISKKLEGIGVSGNLIKNIANNTSALSEDGLKFFEFNENEISKVESESTADESKVIKIWLDFIEILKDFLEQTNPKKIRRFRHLIPVERIVKLADMLNQLIYKIR